MYTTINLNSEILKKFSLEGKKEISNLSQINIFIGPNNSGKSMFMRELYANKNMQFLLKDFDYVSYVKNIEKLQTDIRHKLKIIGVGEIDIIDFSRFKVNNSLIFMTNNFSNIKSTHDYIKKINSEEEFYSINKNVTDEVKSSIQNLTNEFLQNNKAFDNFDEEILKREFIYIPTLRGLRGFKKSTDDKNFFIDTFKDRTIKDYFHNFNNLNNKRIYTGLSLYEDLMRLLLGDSKDRKKVQEFESFLSTRFFDSKDISIVPKYDEDVVHVKIGNEKDKPIYNLGDGIQSIIILTYPLFFNKGKYLNVFFEEPDMFLHPGFQRIFIETLQLPEFNTYQFYFTTHSNNFLDMTLDFNSISVFQFKKKQEDVFEIINIKNENEDILSNLGVRNSSVFLSNSTLWVEGISERIYFRKYLELYQNKLKAENKDVKIFKEDIHFSFIEYSGGNITHWSFIDDKDTENTNIDYSKISNNIFLITDKDESKEKRHEELLKNLGKDHYYCLECREIENLISPEILKLTITNYKKKNSEDIEFKNFKQNDYINKAIGKFIPEIIDDSNKIQKFITSPKTENSTPKIRDKSKFAKNVVKNIKNYDDLSIEAQKLTEIIYEFIKNKN